MEKKLKYITLYYIGKEREVCYYTFTLNEDKHGLLDTMKDLQYDDESINAVLGYLEVGVMHRSTNLNIFHDGKKLITSYNEKKVYEAAYRKLNALNKIDKLGIIGNIQCYNAVYQTTSSGLRIINCKQDGDGIKRCNVIYGKGIVILLYDGNVTDVFSGEYTIHNK